MMLSKLVAPQNLPDLPDEPYHPSSTFVGKAQIVKRYCQSSWFSKWKWLHYREEDDIVFSHLCVHAIKSKMAALK